MTLYVGLDVSQKTAAICVVDHGGQRIWRGECRTLPDEIAAVILRHAGDNAQIGIETGSMTPWLVRTHTPKDWLFLPSANGRQNANSEKRDSIGRICHDPSGGFGVLRNHFFTCPNP